MTSKSLTQLSFDEAVVLLEDRNKILVDTIHEKLYPDSPKGIWIIHYRDLSKKGRGCGSMSKLGWVSRTDAMRLKIKLNLYALSTNKGVSSIGHKADIWRIPV